MRRRRPTRRSAPPTDRGPLPGRSAQGTGWTARLALKQRAPRQRAPRQRAPRQPPPHPPRPTRSRWLVRGPRRIRRRGRRPIHQRARLWRRRPIRPRRRGPTRSPRLPALQRATPPHPAPEHPRPRRAIPRRLARGQPPAPPPEPRIPCWTQGWSGRCRPP